MADRVLLMGVLNITPDSFYDGGRYEFIENALRRAEELVRCGADILDIGGESTRPGSEPVSLDEELKRVIPVVKKIKESLAVCISVDTQKAEVARQAVRSGAEIINDISALRGDPEMAVVVANSGVRIILMHMKGTPRDMQVRPEYKDVVAEIKSFFYERIAWAESRGIKKNKIVIDPGIGFGKLFEHNLEILRSLAEFKEFGLPILVGPSRKAFIGKILGKEPQDRLWGTAGAVAASVLNGAGIVRVHDVAEMRDVVRVAELVR